MIIPNGTLEFKVKTAPGKIDPKTGYPTKATSEWSKPIPCQFAANNRNQQGRVNGEHFTIATYTILIEEPLAETPCTEQLRLNDQQGRSLGEFSVISSEPLPAVCQLKILV